MENIGVNLHEFGLGTTFLDTTSKVQVAKDVTDKLYFIKIKTLWFKGHNQESEKSTHRRGSIFTNCISDKGLVSMIYKEHLQFNNKNMNYVTYEEVNRHFPNKHTHERTLNTISH